MKMQKTSQQLNKTETALLVLIRRSLFGDKTELSEEEQISALKESRKQAVYCIAADKCDLSGEVAEKVKKNQYTGIVYNSKIHTKHNLLAGILESEKIPYVIIKGSASAMYYPNPVLRMMGDIDFYVPEAYKKKAYALLEKNGFEKLNVNHSFHTAFKKYDTSFELHFKAPTNASGPLAEKIEEYLNDITEKATRLNNSLDNILVPSVFHHGLILLLHTALHLFYDGVGLRHLLDWAVFINRLSNDEFNEIFKDKLISIGLFDFAKTLSLASHVAFNIEYKEFMGDNKKLAEKILFDIFDSGSNGRKNIERRGENLFINNRYSAGSSSRAKLFTKSVNESIYAKFPLVKKLKIFLPFIWLFLAIRRLVREKFNLRYPLKIFKSYKNSKYRDELYSKLNIFKVD